MASDSERRVLIVGGLGYLGSRLAHAFSTDASVTVTSRSLSPSREKWLNAHSGRVRWVEFNSATQEQLPLEGGFDCILNLAMPSAAEAAKDEGEALEGGLRTVRACSDLAAEGRSARLVHFSTFHVYGAHNRDRFCEEDVPEPAGPYGRIHMHCERAALNLDCPADVVIVRPTNVVGSPAHDDFGAQSGLVFLDLCRQAAQDHRIKLRTDGVAYRDFIAMPDAIEAVKLLSAGDFSADRTLPVFNLSSGRAMRLDWLAHEIQREAQDLLDCEISIETGKDVDRFAQPFEVANHRLRYVGWEPRISLKDDIRETMLFFDRESAR